MEDELRSEFRELLMKYKIAVHNCEVAKKQLNAAAMSYDNINNRIAAIRNVCDLYGIQIMDIREEDGK